MDRDLTHAIRRSLDSLDKIGNGVSNVGTTALQFSPLILAATEYIKQRTEIEGSNALEEGKLWNGVERRKNV